MDQPIKVDGWDEFKKQLVRVKDSVKHSEIIKVQRRVAKPLVEKTKLTAPEGPTGNLVDSIGIVKGRSKTYPNIYVTARVKGKNKGHHAHFVHQGTGARKKRSGAKTGSMPKNAFLDRAYKATKSGFETDYARKLSRYLQRRIDRLSTK